MAGWLMFSFQLGGFPSWSEGLGRGIENHENCDFCGMWQRVSQKADQGQILPWSQVLMFSPCEIGKKNQIYIILCKVRPSDTEVHNGQNQNQRFPD